MAGEVPRIPIWERMKLLDRFNRDLANTAYVPALQRPYVARDFNGNGPDVIRCVLDQLVESFQEHGIKPERQFWETSRGVITHGERSWGFGIGQNRRTSTVTVDTGTTHVDPIRYENTRSGEGTRKTTETIFHYGIAITEAADLVQWEYVPSVYHRPTYTYTDSDFISPPSGMIDKVGGLLMKSGENATEAWALSIERLGAAMVYGKR